MSESRALRVSRDAAALARLPLARPCWRALSAGRPAATLRTIEQAYELTRNQVQLPASPEGSLTVRPCATCRPVVLRVTAATTWFSRPGVRQPAGQPPSWLRSGPRQRDPGTLVYVYYEPQTRRVKRVVLDLPAPVPGR